MQPGKFKDNLGYTTRPCLKNTKQKPKTKTTIKPVRQTHKKRKTQTGLKNKVYYACIFLKKDVLSLRRNCLKDMIKMLYENKSNLLKLIYKI
jgi:hypothetical protein